MAKEIELTQGKVAIVDDGDYELVSRYKWHAVHNRQTFYAANKTQEMIYMHRLILGNPDGDIDHIDGDGLNNTRSNLRVVTNRQNHWNIRKPVHNTTGYKGVSKLRNKFVAKLQKDKTKYYLGVYETAADAAMAYDSKATEVFGEYARLNNQDGSHQ